MPVTTRFGLPYAVGTEFATDYPATVDEPRAALLDGMLGGAYCHARGLYSSAPSGQLNVPLTEIKQQTPGFVLESGRIKVPIAGVYLVISMGNSQTFQNHMYIGLLDDLISGYAELRTETGIFGGVFQTTVFPYAAGALVPTVMVYQASNPGASGQVQQTVVHIGALPIA